MAEIGLAASVIAVIQIATAVTTQAYDYGQKVKNAKEDLEGINRALEDLKGILDQLKDLAQEAEASDQPWPTLASLNKSDGPLNDCTIALGELVAQLPLVNGTRAKFVERFKWAWKKGKVEKSLEAILKQKNVFIESLNVDQA
jgi:hypothetical protein